MDTGLAGGGESPRGRKDKGALNWKEGRKKKKGKGGAKTSYFWERGAKRKRKVKDHYPRPSLSISIPLIAAI